MGGGELGVRSVWGLRGGGEDGPSGVPVVVGVGEGEVNGRFGSAVGVVEAPALEARAAFSALAKTILLHDPITDPAFRQTKEQELKPHQTKNKASVTHKAQNANPTANTVILIHKACR